MKFKIKKLDKVIVLTGKEKGKTGIVSKIITKNSKVLIEGVNQVKCFNKKEKTGMTVKSMPIHISNVAHVDPVSGAPTKVKYVQIGEEKQLVAKKSGKVIR